jgi:uncharacterized repeat protein (TIGR03943 family)
LHQPAFDGNQAVGKDHQPDGQCSHKTGSGGAGIEIATLLILAAFMAFSFFSGRISVFLAPDYVWLTPTAALVLSAMFAARLFGYARGAASCACHSQSTGTKTTWACAAVLILPVVTVLVVNPTQLSPEGARKRQVTPLPRNVHLELAVDWVMGIKRAKKKPTGSVELPKNPTIIDLMNAAAEYHPDDLDGRFVNIEGQCGFGSDAADERFDLYRLVVNCCIADATTVPLEIVRPKKKTQLSPGGWVRVQGMIKFDNPMDPSMPVIEAAKISKIAEPSEPYL